MGDSCGEPAPELLLRGIEEFNAGAYFECHETLETLWRAETRPIRRLYQGILLVGVALYKVFEQRNYVGALSLLDRGLAHLQGFPPRCHGLDVELLRGDGRRLRQELLRLGPGRFSELDGAYVPRVSAADHAVA